MNTRKEAAFLMALSVLILTATTQADVLPDWLRASILLYWTAIAILAACHWLRETFS